MHVYMYIYSDAAHLRRQQRRLRLSLFFFSLITLKSSPNTSAATTIRSCSAVGHVTEVTGAVVSLNMHLLTRVASLKWAWATLTLYPQPSPLNTYTKSTKGHAALATLLEGPQPSPLDTHTKSPKINANNKR